MIDTLHVGPKGTTALHPTQGTTRNEIEDKWLVKH